jgi:hypothetical protein
MYAAARPQRSKIGVLRDSLAELRDIQLRIFTGTITDFS